MNNGFHKQGEVYIPPELSGRELGVATATHIVKVADQAAERVISLTEKYQEALAVLDDNSPKIKASWLDWVDETKTYLASMQQTRVAIQQECRATITAMRDVSDLLGSAKVKEDCVNLRELIELCERARALKESGFLDAVVDTLVKIPSK